MNGKFVTYYRVSTARQGRSGLGLDAQQKSVLDYLNGGSWMLIGEYIEVESGKRSDNRPKLQEALKHCKMTGATLVISKVDRLARNVAFVSALMESGVEFVAVDMPAANKLTIHIITAVAEEEARAISKRTKDALDAAKRRGVELGGCRFPGQGLSKEAIAKGRVLGDEAKRAKADKFAAEIKPVIQDLRGKDMSYRNIASWLNKENYLTARGKAGGWTAMSVMNVMNRQI